MDLPFHKLGEFLDSFDENHPDYAAVLRLKQKLAQDLANPDGMANADIQSDNPDMTISTPQQQDSDNTVLAPMLGAFAELDEKNRQEKEQREPSLKKKQPANMLEFLRDRVQKAQ